MSYNMKPPTLEYNAPPPPYYAPLPGYTQPRRSSRRWLWITLGIIALVAILGGTLLAFYYNSPLRTSDMYYSAIKTQDYATAYSYLGSGLQREYSQQTFAQAAQQQDEVLGRVSRFGMGNITVDGFNPASITLTVTRTNGSIYDVHLELQWEGGAWKVTAFDRI
jgi:hypothetical protein